MTVQELIDSLNEHPKMAEVCIFIENLTTAKIEVRKKDGSWYWIVGTDGYVTPHPGPHV